MITVTTASEGGLETGRFCRDHCLPRRLKFIHVDRWIFRHYNPSSPPGYKRYFRLLCECFSVTHWRNVRCSCSSDVNCALIRYGECNDDTSLCDCTDPDYLVDHANGDCSLGKNGVKWLNTLTWNKHSHIRN